MSSVVEKSLYISAGVRHVMVVAYGEFPVKYGNIIVSHM